VSKNKISFKERNIIRKQNREDGIGRLGLRPTNEARRRRRIYGGSFGNAPTHIFNELVLGTGGKHRTEKQAQS
jgi:hypothetical protein